MELNKAIEIVLSLARDNVINDPGMQEQTLEQEDAIGTLEMFLDESLGDSPSPIQVVLETEGAVIHQVISNVPVQVTVLEIDLEGAEDGSCRLLESMNGSEYYIGSPSVEVDPLLTADIVKEATA